MAYYLVTTSLLPRYYIATTSLLHRYFIVAGAFTAVSVSEYAADSWG